MVEQHGQHQTGRGEGHGAEGVLGAVVGLGDYLVLAHVPEDGEGGHQEGDFHHRVVATHGGAGVGAVKEGADLRRVGAVRRAQISVGLGAGKATVNEVSGKMAKHVRCSCTGVGRGQGAWRSLQWSPGWGSGQGGAGAEARAEAARPGGKYARRLSLPALRLGWQQASAALQPGTPAAPMTRLPCWPSSSSASAARTDRPTPPTLRPPWQQLVTAWPTPTCGQPAALTGRCRSRRDRGSGRRRPAHRAPGSSARCLHPQTTAAAPRQLSFRRMRKDAAQLPQAAAKLAMNQPVAVAVDVAGQVQRRRQQQAVAQAGHLQSSPCKVGGCTHLGTSVSPESSATAP